MDLRICDRPIFINSTTASSRPEVVSILNGEKLRVDNYAKRPSWIHFVWFTFLFPNPDASHSVFIIFFSLLFLVPVLPFGHMARCVDALLWTFLSCRRGRLMLPWEDRFSYCRKPEPSPSMFRPSLHINLFGSLGHENIIRHSCLN